MTVESVLTDGRDKPDAAVVAAVGGKAGVDTPAADVPNR